ncbi:MAG: SdpI family protein [Clostridium sp.]|uniref:SdpI family protein n=1 Tax=Clostridium sp. TaxID=1506 RepID=UPI002FC5E138
MFMDLIWVSLIPLIYIFSGVLLYKFPPKSINSFYGYRTSRSMKNEEVFAEANSYSGKLIINTGFIYISIAIFMIGLTYEFENLFWVTYWGIIGFVLIFLGVVFLKTESHLKHFLGEEDTGIGC